MSKPTLSKMETAEDLGRRAVACEGWRWMPGMLMDCSRPYIFRIVKVDGDGCPRECVCGGIFGPGRGSADGDMRAWDWQQWREHGMLPDLTDPATLGCLLALVREAWGDPNVGVFRPDLSWRVQGDIRSPACSGKSEAEALVSALEAEVTNLKRAQHLAERADPVGRCPHCLVNVAMGAEAYCERCAL